MEYDMDIFSLISSLGVETPEIKDKNKQENTAKKTAESTKDKRDQTKAGVETKVSAPVRCFGEYFCTVINEAENIDDCVKQLQLLGFGEILLSEQYVLINESTLYFPLTEKMANDNVQVSMPMKVCAGTTRMELNEEDFPELDPDEISVLEVLERWTLIHPEYGNCSLAYDPRYGVAVPICSKKEKKDKDNIDLPVDVSVFGNRVTLTQKDIGIVGIVTSEALREYLCSEYSLQFHDAKIVLYESHGMICTGLQSKKKKCSLDCSAYMVDKSAKIANVIESYRLPLTLYMANFNITKSLTPEDFAGKERIENEDIIQYVKKDFPIFRSHERKADIIYLKERNMVSVAVTSGKKG